MDDLLNKTKSILIEYIYSFSKLKKNWNGYHANPITKNVCNNAVGILNILTLDELKLVECFPTGRNSIQMEWHKKDLYLEFEVYKNKTMYLFYNFSSKQQISGKYTPNKINDYFLLLETEEE